MEAPTLVLVPPTPVDLSRPTPGNRTSSGSETARRSTIDHERTSTETATIFTIYSMYGDADAPGSWSASASASDPDAATTSKLATRETSYCDSKRSTTDLAYRHDSIAESQRFSSYGRPTSTGSTSNGPAQSPRPHSAQVAASSRNSDITSNPRRATTSQKRQTNGSAHPPQSRRTSQSFDAQLPPIIPSSHPKSSSPTPTSASSNAPSSLSPPHTPPMPHPHNALASPSSQGSIVASDGEEPDSFHVRSTYATLEVYGVKGDGYVEGLERTRARIGGSRNSEMRALDALDDGTEKMRELSEKEIETLKNLDRYGFFSIPSHDRLVRVPSGPLSKQLRRVSAGPRDAPSHPTALNALPTPALPIKEALRIEKWGRMLEPRERDQGANIQAWGIRASKEHKLRERTYKGIPDRWRSAAWEVLMTRYAKTGKTQMQKFGEDYREALDKASTYDVQIDLDVPRTISGHIMFRTRYGAGQRSLFHVLHCFSLRCESCGYVQGMGPIAATLLCYLEPERVYASLVRLHDAYSLHSIFNPGFPGLLEAIYVQERITEQMMPDVYAAFKKHMISTTSYATKWYITLFANSVPFQTQLRLWDAFLLDGPDVFVGVSIAIVWAYRDHITASAANFETILSMLSSFFVPEDENVFLVWIGKMLGDKKLRTSMTQWRETWKGLVASGKDGDALL